jgi:hypothetical protein
VTDGSSSSPIVAGVSETTDRDPDLPQVTTGEAKLGDEYISLTFVENESEDESEDDEDEEENEGDH